MPYRAIYNTPCALDAGWSSGKPHGMMISEIPISSKSVFQRIQFTACIRERIGPCGAEAGIFTSLHHFNSIQFNSIKVYCHVKNTKWNEHTSAYR